MFTSKMISDMVSTGLNSLRIDSHRAVGILNKNGIAGGKSDRWKISAKKRECEAESFSKPHAKHIQCEVIEGVTEGIIPVHLVLSEKQDYPWKQEG